LANFANCAAILDLQQNDVPEFLRISNIIFECFSTFTQKWEEMGEIQIDLWAEIQTEDGANSISNLLVWTAYLSSNVGFPLFYNFFLYF